MVPADAALVVSVTTVGERTVALAAGLLSQPFLMANSQDDIVLPMASWQKTGAGPWELQDAHAACTEQSLHWLWEYSPYNSAEELRNAALGCLAKAGEHARGGPALAGDDPRITGTMVELFALRSNELRFDCADDDITLDEQVRFTHTRIREPTLEQGQRMGPTLDTSFRAYLAVLYGRAGPDCIKIILRGVPVVQRSPADLLEFEKTKTYCMGKNSSRQVRITLGLEFVPKGQCEPRASFGRADDNQDDSAGERELSKRQGLFIYWVPNSTDPGAPVVSRLLKALQPYGKQRGVAASMFQGIVGVVEVHDGLGRLVPNPAKQGWAMNTATYEDIARLEVRLDEVRCICRILYEFGNHKVKDAHLKTLNPCVRI